MPEITAATFSLEGLQPGELEQRRQAIIRTLNEKYQGYEDPSVPMELLQELVAVTQQLRRRTAGAPKTNKTAAERMAKRSTKRASVDDLADLL